MVEDDVEITEIATCNKPLTIDIDRNGDVVLNLTLNDHIQIRVSSKVLAVASPMFAAMFDGRFSEGQGLSSTSPRTIDLPGDDGRSMYLLCKLLYHQALEEIKVWNIDGYEKSCTLVHLTVIANKYICKESIQATMKYTIMKALSTKLTNAKPDMWFNFLAVAYSLDHQRLFWETSQQVVRVLHDRGTLRLMDSLPVTTGLIGPEIITYLECRRRWLQSDLVVELKTTLTSNNLLNHDPLIWFDLTRISRTWSGEPGRPSSLLASLATWAHSGCSVQNFLDCVRLDLSEHDEYGLGGDATKQLTPNKLAFVHVVREKLGEISRGSSARIKYGLCLECFKLRAANIRSCSGNPHVLSEQKSTQTKRRHGNDETEIQVPRTRPRISLNV